MRLTKKILAVIVAVVCVFAGTIGALADGITAEITDNVNGIVTISGTAPGGVAGKTVNILVTNTGYTADDAADDPTSAIQYQDSVVTGAGGTFTKNFMLNFGADDEVGTYTIYIGGEDFTEVEELSLYYASMGLKIEKAQDFLTAQVLENEDDEDEEVTYAHEVLETYKNIFGIDKALYNSLDKLELTKLFKSYLTDEGVEFTTPLEDNVEANTEIYVAFDELLNNAIIIEGFNQDKKDLLISDGALVYNTEAGLSAYLGANGTLAAVYSDITAIGKTNAMNALFSQDVESYEELQVIYAKAVILNAIKNNTTSGYGIITDILTESNAAAAELSIPNYLALSSKTLANNALYTSRGDLTLSNLAEEIENSAEAKETVKQPSGDDNDNGGSVSLGSGGSISVEPVVTPAEDTTATFTDLAGYDWAKDAISVLAEKNIINGVGNNMFNPAGSLTREAAAKIIMLALDIAQKNGETAFGDVDENMWYAPYVYTLNANGIVRGVSDSLFGVGSRITREDFAVMLYRALGASYSGEELTFTDADSISSYAAAAVGYFVQQGIINGYEDGNFAPKAYITRAEGAKIIYSIIK